MLQTITNNTKIKYKFKKAYLLSYTFTYQLVGKYL